MKITKIKTLYEHDKTCSYSIRFFNSKLGREREVFLGTSTLGKPHIITDVQIISALKAIEEDASVKISESTMLNFLRKQWVTIIEKR